MNRLDTAKRTQILSALVEGASVRSVCRMTGASKNTVAKLLIAVGAACSEYQDKHLVNITSKRIQVDEIWSFIGAKDKNIEPEKQGKFGRGSIWTWVALDPDSKLVCSWMVGPRDAETGYAFMLDLAARLANRVQLTSDGYQMYREAVTLAFGRDVDYAMLVKKYGESPDSEKRYSPGVCLGADKRPVTGNPDPKHISTSHVERQNLTMRMCMRRFTRLTNAFSKKLENHIAAIALHFMYYNFVRIHQTLRITPSMAAGVASSPWEVSDIVKMLEEFEREQEPIRKVVQEEKRIQGMSEKGPALGF